MPTITVSKEKYNSMKETLEILGDSKLMEEIREGIKEICSGRTVPLSKFRK